MKKKRGRGRPKKYGDVEMVTLALTVTSDIKSLLYDVTEILGMSVNEYFNTHMIKVLRRDAKKFLKTGDPMTDKEISDKIRNLVTKDISDRYFLFSDLDSESDDVYVNFGKVDWKLFLNWMTYFNELCAKKCEKEELAELITVMDELKYRLSKAMKQKSKEEKKKQEKSK